jgi:hypothetical protein
MWFAREHCGLRENNAAVRTRARTMVCAHEQCNGQSWQMAAANNCKDNIRDLAPQGLSPDWSMMAHLLAVRVPDESLCGTGLCSELTAVPVLPNIIHHEHSIRRALHV